MERARERRKVNGGHQVPTSVRRTFDNFPRRPFSGSPSISELHAHRSLHTAVWVVQRAVTTAKGYNFWCDCSCMAGPYPGARVQIWVLTLVISTYQSMFSITCLKLLLLTRSATVEVINYVEYFLVFVLSNWWSDSFSRCVAWVASWGQAITSENNWRINVSNEGQNYFRNLLMKYSK